MATMGEAVRRGSVLALVGSVSHGVTGYFIMLQNMSASHGGAGWSPFHGLHPNRTIAGAMIIVDVLKKGT
jgi:hypothetical protein